jgi:hypothetical protein
MKEDCCRAPYTSPWKTITKRTKLPILELYIEINWIREYQFFVRGELGSRWAHTAASARPTGSGALLGCQPACGEQVLG